MRIAGVDARPDTGDIDIASRFNANLGTTGCLEASGWYYGLDGNTPAGSINFLDVVMHEIGHGLGFQGFDDMTTGAFFAGSSPTSIRATCFDNASGQAWTALTNRRRVIGGDRRQPGVDRRRGHRRGAGRARSAAAPRRLRGRHRADYTIGHRRLRSAGVARQLHAAASSRVNDGECRDLPLGCVASPAGAYTGKIALVDRGTCCVQGQDAQCAERRRDRGDRRQQRAGRPRRAWATIPPMIGTITIPSIGVTQPRRHRDQAQAFRA